MSQRFFESSADIAAPTDAVWSALKAARGLKARVEHGAGAMGA